MPRKKQQVFQKIGYRSSNQLYSSVNFSHDKPFSRRKDFSFGKVPHSVIRQNIMIGNIEASTLNAF